MKKEVVLQNHIDEGFFFNTLNFAQIWNFFFFLFSHTNGLSPINS